jgi:hypothetical protein
MREASIVPTFPTRPFPSTPTAKMREDAREKRLKAAEDEVARCAACVVRLATRIERAHDEIKELRKA